jgi:tetratricopeptide (TPR) repeat protein
MLEAIARTFDDATLLVTFNGRSFDVPLMEMRWAFHRTSAATDDLPHFDMLPSARRLWSRRELRDAPDRASCTLTSLERAVLGFHRVNDVPGFEIPARYFHFLRSGDAAVIDGVLEHNRYDLLSLAAVMSHALWMAGEGPDACREPSEQLGLGLVYERAGQNERAMDAYERAACSGSDRDVRAQALAHLAPMLARLGRYDASAAAWLGVLEAAHGRSDDMAALQRRAAQALAIHHEHRARDLAAARRYAASLQASAAGRAREDAAHRLQRIDRKIGRAITRPLL